MDWRLSLLLTACATVVFGAVVAKAYVLATVPFFQSLPFGPVVTAAVAGAELLYCVWIALGRETLRAKWLGTIVFFSSFAVISAVRAVRGDVSCGCFGRFSPTPPVMFTFDIGMVVLLGLARPQGVFRQRPVGIGMALRSVVAAWLGLMIASSLLIAGARSRIATGAALSANEGDAETRWEGADGILGKTVRLPGGRTAVLLEPDRWVGQAFPLLPYIEPAELRTLISAAKKDFEIVIFRRDCDKCRKFLLQIGARTGKHEFHTVLLEVPSLETQYVPVNTELSSTSYGALIRSIEWHVSTPTVLHLSQGTVVSVDRDVRSASGGMEDKHD